jgi:hypothetical protein
MKHLLTGQRILIACGLAAFVFCGLSPPWLYTRYEPGTADRSGFGSARNAGCWFIFFPPEPESNSATRGVRIDRDRLAIEWFCIVAVVGAGWVLATKPDEGTHAKATP